MKKCVVCGIKLEDNKPIIMPCGIGGPDRAKHRLVKERRPCPYETEEERKKLIKFRDFEKIAGLLGTMHGENI